MYSCVSGLISDTRGERETGETIVADGGRFSHRVCGKERGEEGVEHEMCIFRFQFLCHSLPKSQGKDNNNNSIKRSANKHTYTNNTHSRTHTLTHTC